MMFLDFTNQLDELREIIADGLAFFSAWQELIVGDDDAAQALNRYRGLFLTARTALLRATIIQFAKMFDPDPRTLSLRTLLRTAKRNPDGIIPYGSSQDLQDIERKLRSNKAILERLKAFRDQRIAHHDAVASRDIELLFGEMKRLAEDVESMYNSLRRGHDQQHTSFETMARDAKQHTAAVVRIMQEERDRGLERIREADELLRREQEGQHS